MLVLACLTGQSRIALGAGQGPWTAADVDRVADAALELLQRDDTRGRTDQFIELASALQRAGRTERSREVLLKAAAKLDPPTDFFSVQPRAKIVRFLAAIGDEAGAKALADVETQPGLHAALLGALGTGFAEAGRTDAAVAIADTIMALPIPPARLPIILDPRINALGKIGTAMSQRSVAGTLAIAAKSPGSTTSLHMLRDLAEHACRPAAKPAERSGDDRRISEAAAHFARALKNQSPPSAPASPSSADVALAVEAIVLCDGAPAASSFMADVVSPRDTFEVMAEVQDRALATQDARLASAAVFPPNPGDPASQFETAQTLVLAGRSAEAREMALAAAGLLARSDPNRPVSEARIDHAFKALAQVGEWNAALGLAERLDVRTRQHFYAKAVSDQISRHDREALSWTVPAAVATFQQPGGESTLTLLVDLTRRLAVAGYDKDAQKPYEAYQAYINQGKPLPPNLWPWLRAAMQADLGDLEGARATANAAGPMVAPPSDVQVMAATAMAFAAPGSRPTQAEAAAMAERMRTEMGLRPGPKALALQEIASDLARQGRIAEAWTFEAELEPTGSNDEVLAEARDGALAALAEAQLKAGDPQGAFATVLRLTPRSHLKARLMLELAAVPPRA